MSQTSEKIKGPKRDSVLRELALADLFTTDLKFPIVFWSGLYWKWTGTHYIRFGDTDEVRSYILRWLGSEDISSKPGLARDVELNLRAWCSSIGQDQAMPGFIGSSTQYPRRITLLNGVLDLDPMSLGKLPILRNHSQEWFTTSCLPFKYEPGAECPWWIRTLNEWLENDEQRINLLQEFFGYCCTFDTSQEKALFMEGNGGNGKSQAIEVLRRLVGPENCSSVALEVMFKRFQAVQTLGKLVNLAPETDAQVRIPVAMVRNFITGDPMSFERKGVDTFSAVPTARLVIAMNTRANLSDNTNALWRRVMLMPFNFEVSKENRILDLGKKIAAKELPGIFMWAIEGLRRLWANKAFTESQVVTDAVNDMRDEKDPVRAVLVSLYEYDTDGFVSSEDLIIEYRKRCALQEIEPNVTESSLRAHLKRVFPRSIVIQKRLNGRNCRGRGGIQLQKETSNVCN